MKNYLLFTLNFVFILLLTNAGHAQTGSYKDGTYKGKSRSIYVQEPYWGKVTVTVKGGKIANVNFVVIDSSKNEEFDDKYERYFAGNDNYVQQCRNDREGIKVYPNIVVEKQKLDEVDAISGATWSYNLLKSSLKDALKDAKM